MRAKLTLSIDGELLLRARAYARTSGRSLSQLVSDYLAVLPEPRGNKAQPLTPIVRSLRGVLLGSGLDEEDYRRHLEEKEL
jgi:hypothetical protein